MKTALTKTLILLSLLPAAYARDPRNICTSNLVIGKIADSDKCQVVAVERVKKTKLGSCTGMVMKALPCQASFYSSAQGALIKLVCGLPGQEPKISQTFPVQSSEYNVAALIKQQDGNQFLIHDPKDYTNLASTEFELALIEDGASIQGAMAFSSGDKIIEMDNVRCSL